MKYLTIFIIFLICFTVSMLTYNKTYIYNRSKYNCHTYPSKEKKQPYNIKWLNEEKDIVTHIPVKLKHGTSLQSAQKYPLLGFKWVFTCILPDVKSLPDITTMHDKEKHDSVSFYVGCYNTYLILNNRKGKNTYMVGSEFNQTMDERTDLEKYSEYCAGESFVMEYDGLCGNVMKIGEKEPFHVFTKNFDTGDQDWPFVGFGMCNNPYNDYQIDVGQINWTIQ